MEAFDVGLLWEILKGSGFAALGAILGGLLGLVLSLVIVVVAYMQAAKREWPAKEPWGVWCRRIGGVLWLIGMPLTLVPAFGFWGFGIGAVHRIDSESLVEKSCEASLGLLIAEICVVLEAPNEVLDFNDEKRRAAAEAYADNSKTIPVETLQLQVDELKSDLVHEIAKEVEKRLKSMAENKLTGFAAWIGKHVWTWVANTQIEEYSGYVDDVLKDLDEGGAEAVTAAQISASIGKVHLKPRILKACHQYIRIQVLIMVAPGLGLLLLIPISLEITRRCKRKSA
ncbi:MAG: hypothetical protein AAF585_25925, partial [Verrucomicrobiota bacterium]